MAPLTSGAPVPPATRAPAGPTMLGSAARVRSSVARASGAPAKARSTRESKSAAITWTRTATARSTTAALASTEIREPAVPTTTSGFAARERNSAPVECGAPVWAPCFRRSRSAAT